MKQLPPLFHIIREPMRKSEGKAPLLLLLHGLGSDEKDLFGLVDEFDPRFFVASARAPLPLGPEAWAWFQVEYTADGPRAQPGEAEASRLAILDLIDALVVGHGLDARRVYLAGFSQGAIMGLAVALTKPASLAGLVAMSGRFPYQIEDGMAPGAELARLSILDLHGTRDEVLPIRFGREVRDRLSALPIAFEYNEYEMAHEISAESLARATAWLTERLDLPPR